jgi:hypothetical protein
MATQTPEELLDDLVTNNQDAAEIFNKLRDYVETNASITFKLSTGDVTVDSLQKQIGEFNTEKDTAFENFARDFRAPQLINDITYNTDGTVATITEELETGWVVESTYTYSGDLVSSVDVVLKDANGTQQASFTRTISYSGDQITGVS